MDNLLLVILVIIFVFMCSQLMKNMCGQQLVEGIFGPSVLDYGRDPGCGEGSYVCGYGCGGVLSNDNAIEGDDYDCRKCPVGKYNRSNDVTVGCKTCPSNSTTPAGTTGASSISQCNACKGNYYKSGTNTNGAVCSACPQDRPFSLSRSTSENDCIKPDPRYCLPYIELKKQGRTDDNIKKLLQDTVAFGNNYTLTKIGNDGQWTRAIGGHHTTNKIIWDDNLFDQFKEGNSCLNCLLPYYMTNGGKCGFRAGGKCPVGGGWWGPTCSDENNKPVPRALL